MLYRELEPDSNGLERWFTDISLFYRRVGVLGLLFIHWCFSLKRHRLNASYLAAEEEIL